MPNSIAVFLGITLTVYIISLIGGVVGIALLAIILLIYFIVFKNMDSHDKRFNNIVELSAQNNKPTTGKDFGIKPIKFKDELERTRYADSNYEEKNNKTIIITNHFMRDDNYKTYRVEIENFNGEALINSKLLESI
jgi:hypothetical protein